jgi:hypothetical protein
VYTNLLKDLQDAMADLEKALGYDKQKFQLELKAKVPVSHSFALHLRALQLCALQSCG